jgi:hypothetical protein
MYMGTVNTTLPRYPSIINQYSNHSLFYINSVLMAVVIMSKIVDSDHDIDNGGFHEILGVAICLMIFR